MMLFAFMKVCFSFLRNFKHVSRRPSISSLKSVKNTHIATILDQLLHLFEEFFLWYRDMEVHIWIRLLRMSFPFLLPYTFIPFSFILLEHYWPYCSCSVRKKRKVFYPTSMRRSFTCCESGIFCHVKLFPSATPLCPLTGLEIVTSGCLIMEPVIMQHSLLNLCGHCAFFFWIHWCCAVCVLRSHFRNVLSLCCYTFLMSIKLVTFISVLLHTFGCFLFFE